MDLVTVRPLLLLVVLQSALWPQTPQQSTHLPGPVVLPAGTLVRLRSTQYLDSKSNNAASVLTLEVMRDVKAGDLLVIAKHTPVTAHFTAQPAKRGLRPGALYLTVDSVQDITGNTVVIAGRTKATIDSRKQDYAVDEALHTWLITALWVRGTEAALPKGTEIDATVSKDVSLDSAAFKQAMAASAAEAAAAREKSRTGKATVDFYLYPEPEWVKSRKGAVRGENHVVSVDGNKVVKLFVGQTYEMQIAPGHHVVVCHGHDLSVDLSADERYYIRFAPSDNWGPALQDAESGEDEVYPLMQAPAKNVYSPAP